jgi:hypothetical protein
MDLKIGSVSNSLKIIIIAKKNYDTYNKLIVLIAGATICRKTAKIHTDFPTIDFQLFFDFYLQK